MQTKKILTPQVIDKYIWQLRQEEKAAATIEKYKRDINAFYDFLPQDKILKKEAIISYKNYLEQKGYAVSSINSMLVAINQFTCYLGLVEYRVRLFKQQRRSFCDQERELTREEYIRLVQTAQKNKDVRLSLILQTICSTGIRVSELQFITVQSLKRQEAQIRCKGKVRKILLPKLLCMKLKHYCRDKKIVAGSVFVSRNGTSIKRTNIWTAMKKLCGRAKVKQEKVFPHNLRHLFARIFYQQNKDIVRLADVLGHSTIDTTRIYTLTSGNEQLTQLEKLKLLL